MSPHRSTYQQPPLSYVEIGASGAADLMQFPPNAATPFEEELHIGSGQERHLVVANQLMTLGVFPQAGFELGDIRAGSAPEYSDSESLYGPDGTEFAAAGTCFKAAAHDRSGRELCIVSVIHQPREMGFVIGTVDRDNPAGEVRLTVQLRDDGRVWAVARGFFHRSDGLLAQREVKAAIARVKKLLAGLRPGSTA